MMIMYIALWNVVAAYYGIDTLGFQTWAKLTCMFLPLLAFGIPFEALLIVRLSRSALGDSKNLLDLFRKLRQRLREGSSGR